MEACCFTWTPAFYMASKSPSTIPLHEKVSGESVDLESASVQGDTQTGVEDNVHTACTQQPPLSPQDRHPLFIPCFSYSYIPRGSIGIRVLEMFCSPMPASYTTNLHVFEIRPGLGWAVRRRRYVFQLAIASPWSCLCSHLSRTLLKAPSTGELWPPRPCLWPYCKDMHADWTGLN